MNFPIVVNEVFANLVAGFLVFVSFYMGRFLLAHDNGAKFKSTLRVIGGAAFLAFVVWANYGTHTEDADPIYGGGDIVIDFEPTTKRRNEWGAEVFLTLAIPALVGIASATDRHVESFRIKYDIHDGKTG